jgi:hypothetical protein
MDTAFQSMKSVSIVTFQTRPGIVIKLIVMKNLRTLALIVGILVAGLAFTSVANAAVPTVTSQEKPHKIAKHKNKPEKLAKHKDKHKANKIGKHKDKQKPQKLAKNKSKEDKPEKNKYKS